MPASADAVLRLLNRLPLPLPGPRVIGVDDWAKRIRTLKENPLWVRIFDTVEQLRQALTAFRDAYNATWLIERHGFRPPAAIRAEQLPPAALAA